VERVLLIGAAEQSKVISFRLARFVDSGEQSDETGGKLAAIRGHGISPLLLVSLSFLS
jgi:hypothetical protein